MVGSILGVLLNTVIDQITFKFIFVGMIFLIGQRIFVKTWDMYKKESAKVTDTNNDK